MRKTTYIALFLLVLSLSAMAQSLSIVKKAEIESYLTKLARRTVYVPDIRLDSVIQSGQELKMYANINLSYLSFTNPSVKEIYRGVKSMLPASLSAFSLKIFTDTQPIEFLVRENREVADLFANPKGIPVVENLSRPFVPAKGLFNSHLVLWQSHGLYYSQPSRRWEFQRARLFQTVEDLFTQSFVLPFLVPMLENAGAYVFLPRERDYHRAEVIIDNDVSSANSSYLENNTNGSWINGTDSGFANRKDFYLENENPFRMGTYRQISASDNALKLSSCEWVPDMPERGKYAVYISYKSLPNSAEDAQYTVYHLGGQTKFSVNQKMGGGTWIFLGYFCFDKGKSNNCKVVLTNYGKKDGTIITADAVKIGGGMGNIARYPQPKMQSVTDSLAPMPAPVINPQLSYYPRYTEGARYWLQWAGAPDSVYSRTKGENDYLDDFQSRAFWVNYLAGGSSVLPNQQGLNVPVDLAFALHSDAGTTPNDSVVGTLGICMTQFNNQQFENGKSRWTSRDLVEYVMEEVVNSIRREYEPKWTRRQLWNRSYAEARVPNVPSMILEVLSHQNFADMRYGLDPAFRFTVSRAIYKGILKFLAQQHQTDYVVQPLPVNNFYARFSKEKEQEVVLGWKPTEDEKEPSAKPTKYIVYTREDDNDFDNGRVVVGNTAHIAIRKDKIYSFKITAANDGGESFPSEILSVCRRSAEKGVVMIVNAFDRVSAPDHFQVGDTIAGFADYVDHGVPYTNQYNYVGPQTDFDRRSAFVNNYRPGFGASANNFETRVLAGNSFDYPFVHGKAVSDAGYSFVSASRDAVSSDGVALNEYAVVDVILGKQKRTKIGRGAVSSRYKAFPQTFQARIRSYCLSGGNILVSGSFVGSDVWNKGLPDWGDDDFATRILKYKYTSERAAKNGLVEYTDSAQKQPVVFAQQLNDKILAIESPDAIEPASGQARTVFKYAENGLGAGVFYKGKYRTCVLGFPLESIIDEHQRSQTMGTILNWFEK